MRLLVHYEAEMIDEFTDRRKLHAQRSAATGVVPFYAIFLVKGDRCRLYRIDPIDATSWQCQVMIGSRPHRFSTAVGRAQAKLMKAEFEREVGDLIKDGWIETN